MGTSKAPLNFGIAVDIGSRMLYLSQKMYNAEGASAMTVTVSEKGWVVITAELR